MVDQENIPLTQEMVESHQVKPGDIITPTEDLFDQNHQLLFGQGKEYQVMGYFPDVPGGLKVQTEHGWGTISFRNESDPKTYQPKGVGSKFEKVPISYEGLGQELGEYGSYAVRILQSLQEDQGAGIPVRDFTMYMSGKVPAQALQKLLPMLIGGGYIYSSHRNNLFITSKGMEFLGIQQQRKPTPSVLPKERPRVPSTPEEEQESQAQTHVYKFGPQKKPVVPGTPSQVRPPEKHREFTFNQPIRRLRPPKKSSLDLLVFGADTKQKPAFDIDQSLFGRYDTTIFDLDGTLWDCYTARGSGLGAYATVPPYTLKFPDVIVDINGNVIRLQAGVRKLLETLDLADMNLGIMSRGELSDKPFEAQPSVMLLKKFGIYGYFNLEIQLERDGDKSLYVRPLGKTLYVDDDQEIINAINTHGDVDVLWRRSFQTWEQVFTPQQSQLNFSLGQAV